MGCHGPRAQGSRSGGNHRCARRNALRTTPGWRRWTAAKRDHWPTARRIPDRPEDAGSRNSGIPRKRTPDPRRVHPTDQFSASRAVSQAPQASSAGWKPHVDGPTTDGAASTSKHETSKLWTMQRIRCILCLSKHLHHLGVDF